MTSLANILATLSNIQYDNFQLLHKMDKAATTQSRNLNVLSTLMNASSYSSTVVQWLMASTSNSNVIINGSNLPSNQQFFTYVPYILDHQYRVIHEQQLQISALAKIVADQQKLLPAMQTLLNTHDTMIAKHEFNIGVLLKK